MWFVYIVECADNTLYTGITTDISRREEEHNSSDK
jgi:putative endonuclease